MTSLHSFMLPWGFVDEGMRAREAAFGRPCSLRQLRQHRDMNCGVLLGMSCCFAPAGT